MANAIAANAAGIIEANQVDLNSSGLAGAMRERLLLNPERVMAMANGMRDVASLPDPVGETFAHWIDQTDFVFAKCESLWEWWV